MRAIFDSRGVIPAEKLPMEMLKSFNLYHELDNNPKYRECLESVIASNNYGKFASKGREENEKAQHILYGLGAEAWMNLHGAIPDTRVFRDNYLPRAEILVPIDVKAIESKYTSAWLTLEKMSEKVIFNTHGCEDLEELYIWKYYNDSHPTRAGDLEFWKAYRRLDMW